MPWRATGAAYDVRVGGPGAYSQRVAKAKPTAMKPMPTNRFFCPRSVMIGMSAGSLPVRKM